MWHFDQDDPVYAFLKGLEDGARKDLIPKMQNSVFVLAIVDKAGNDLYLALQIGFALLLDKPIIILAADDIWVSPRFAGVAEAVVRGRLNDPATMEQLKTAIGGFLAKRAKAKGQ